jgi:hypothetical protein
MGDPSEIPDSHIREAVVMSENANYLILRVPKHPDLTSRLELPAINGARNVSLSLIFVRRDPEDNVMETWIPWV